MKRRNHMGFLKCYRCKKCGTDVTKAGKLFSKGSRMVFTEVEYANAVLVDGECCE